MSKKIILAIIISLFANLIFTFCLYNVFPPKVLILRYIFSLIFYVVLTIVLYPFVKNKGLLFVITFLPVFIIDAATIFTGPSLMPLRFPFATLFPVAGILFGITILYRKPNLILIVFIALTIFCYSSDAYLIPRIIWFMQYRKTAYNDSFSDKIFITKTHNTVRLKDTAKGKVLLVENYFVQCAPCIEKFKVLEKLRSHFSSSQLSIVALCDGKGSTFDDFARDHQSDQFIYIYDSTGSIQKIPNFQGFPTELLIANNHIYQVVTGNEIETENIYLNSEINKINILLNNE